MKITSILWFLCITACTLQASNEEVGVVQVLRGESPNPAEAPHVVLSNAAQTKKVSLCSGDEIPRISKLGGMEIKVSGEWKGKQNSKDSNRFDNCFIPHKFTVLKASSGRAAITGTLVVKDHQYAVEQEGGSLYPLPLSEKAPERYKELIGQKVIVDINKSFKDGPKVVSVALHP